MIGGMFAIACLRFMTIEAAVKTVRCILPSKLKAVRYLRSLGLTYRTAKIMVDEIAANARWYRMK